MFKTVFLERFTQEQGRSVHLRAKMTHCVTPDWPCALTIYEVLQRDHRLSHGPEWEHEAIVMRLCTPSVTSEETIRRTGPWSLAIPVFRGSNTDFYRPGGGSYERARRACVGHLRDITGLGAQSLQNKYGREVGISSEGILPPPPRGTIVTLEQDAEMAWNFGLSIFGHFPVGKKKYRYGYNPYCAELYSPVLPFWAYGRNLETTDDFIFSAFPVMNHD